MRASCVICTENFTLDSEISASPCGHTFHDECLGRWIRQGSKTCPQCRKQVKASNIIHKLFFNEGDHEDGPEDIGKLKNEIDSLRLNLRQKDREKSECETDQEKLRKRISGLQENVNSMQLLYQQERSKTDTLKKEMVYMNKMQKDAETSKEEAQTLRKKLVSLRNVQDLVNGMISDVEAKVRNTSIQDLATWCLVQEKELKRKKGDCRKLQEDSDVRNKDFVKLRRVYEDKCKRLELVEEKLRMSEEDVNSLERQNQSLKKKIEWIQNSMGTPSGNDEALTRRLINESPAPGPPCKRPRLSEPMYGENIDLNVSAEDLFKSPSSHITPNTKLKNNCKEYGTKFVRITSASSGSSKPSSKSVKDISNLPSIPGLGNLNILKKTMGTGSMLKTESSVIKKGYNGLGGHEHFIQPRGHPFPIAKTKIKKSTSTSGLPYKSIQSNNPPPFPTLDGF